MTDASDDTRDFFISFNKADRTLAEWIAYVLEENRYSVWFQHWDFRHNWVAHMDEAHRQSRRTLLALSDHFLGSRNTGFVRARANSDGCGLEGVATRGHAALRRPSTVAVRRRRSSRRRSAGTGWLWRERRRRKLRSSS